jgi:hypothetical protein
MSQYVSRAARMSSPWMPRATHEHVLGPFDDAVFVVDQVVLARVQMPK